MKIGANEPCPCGSGTKYKRCCRNRKNDITAFKIRAMTEADIARLRAIGTADTSEAPMIERTILGIENHNNLENAYVADFNGEIVGLVHGMINTVTKEELDMKNMLSPEKIPLELLNTSGEIEFSPQYLYVKPDFRGVNLGMRLMETLEGNSGYSRFMVFHESGMQGYYSKQGYTYGDNVRIGRKTLDNRQ